MDILVVNRAEVERLLPLPECIDLMADTLATLARGEAIQPLRTVIALPGEHGFLGTMPAYIGAPPTMAVKLISVFPENEGTTRPSHQGVTVLFDAEHGEPLAFIDAAAITAIRTAAVSGAATRALARADAGDLAILGTGVQAATHLDAMCAVRPIRRVRVWSRTPDRARAFAARAAERTGLEVEAVATARAAVGGADIICTATAAREPVVRGAWLAPGTHVNAVGASVRTTRELDSDAVARARLYVDRRESALHESGDVMMPIAEGRFDASHIVAELGDVLAGTAPGRTSDDEITCFKSLGLAVEDAAAARFIHERALAAGAGARVSLA